MEYIRSRQGTVLIAVAVVFLAIDMWGHIWDGYLTSPFTDIAAHLLFGIWLALALIYRNPTMNKWSIFVAVMLAGLVWEGVEFAYDQLYALPMQITPAQHGITDTLKDIFDNGVGAVLLLSIFREEKSPDSRSPLF